MGKFYKNFDLIDETPLPDFNGKGIYLRHSKTGLEVFHLANDDEENLFSFVVRTPNAASTGAAHIMEHSVFCGSKKFPLKEPFINLVNQSLNTFLNAMTYPDKTVYPASSLNKTDYFNLMDVYGDAVFFPRLEEGTFLQEGRRLELDENGNASIQGVVYNEMKGAYSSFASVAGDYISRSLQKGSIYEYDSGGDPLAIPFFTYEDFCNFHKKFYRPDNILLFLYGSIDTKEQLDFIQEKILDRLENNLNYRGAAFAGDDFFLQHTPEKIDEPIFINEIGPDSGVQGSYASVNWRLGLARDLDSLMETIFTMQVLAGHDGSPVSKALLDSGLGDGLISEIDSSFYTTSVSFGLTGVKKGNEEKVKEIVFSTISDIVKNGADKNNIDAAVLAVDFANREVTRSGGGPYALELLNRAATAWNYGKPPASTLGYRSAFQKIKEQLASDEKYFQKLLDRLFIKNSSWSFVVVTPSSEYTKMRTDKEKEIAQSLAEKFGKEKIGEMQKKFDEYQSREDSSKDAECIPHISPKNICYDRPPIVTERKSFKASDGSDVQVFLNTEPTNGIAYFEVAFPIDTLLPEDYFYLSLLANCLFNTGWNGKNWAACMTDASLCTGDLSAALYLSVPKDISERTEKILKEAEPFKYIWRDWIICQMKMPVEKTKDALSLLSEAICTSEFSDASRLKNLTDDFLNGALEAVVPGASRFMNLRSSCKTSRAKAVGEILHGLTQVNALKKIAKENTQKLGERFTELWEKIKNGGAVVHVTADKSTQKEISPLVEKFILDTKLHSLSDKIDVADEVWFALTEMKGFEKDAKEEIVRCDTQVGCASMTVAPLENYSVSDRAAFMVFNHWVSTNAMWQRIRTAGGAYGAWATSDASSKFFQMYTYRDPQPERSAKEFIECLKDAIESDLAEEEVERALTGTYGEIIQPLSPAGRGSLGFKRSISAISEDDIADLVRNVLSLTKKDILMPAQKILDNIDAKKVAMVIGKKGKKPKNCIDWKN